MRLVEQERPVQVTRQSFFVMLRSGPDGGSLSADDAEERGKLP